MMILDFIKVCLVGVVLLVGTLLPGQSLELPKDEMAKPKRHFDVYLGLGYGLPGQQVGTRQQTLSEFVKKLPDSSMVFNEYRGDMSFRYDVVHTAPELRLGFHYEIPLWKGLGLKLGAEGMRDAISLKRDYGVITNKELIGMDTFPYVEFKGFSGLCDSFVTKGDFGDYFPFDNSVKYRVYYLTIPFHLTYSFAGERWQIGAGMNLTAPVYISTKMHSQVITREKEGDKTVCYFERKEVSVPDDGSIKRLILNGSLEVQYRFRNRWAIRLSSRYFLGDIFTPNSFKKDSKGYIPFTYGGISLSYRLF